MFGFCRPQSQVRCAFGSCRAYGTHRLGELAVHPTVKDHMPHLCDEHWRVYQQASRARDAGRDVKVRWRPPATHPLVRMDRALRHESC